MAKSLALSGNPDADRLLAEDPLALLIGMVLDQQVPLEWAFHGPFELKARLGRDLDAKDIAQHDPDTLSKMFSTPPALHRFPASMAKRVQEMCQVLVDDYDGDAEAVWRDAASGEELRKRIEKLPGFGKMKAKVFVALLGKQLGVAPPGWREAAGDYGPDGTTRSVADIVDGESLTLVREYKRAMKAEAKAKATTPHS